nr:putative ribonuclease H-like domain-containing protein [Tanacetum cinerariifolium]
MEENLHVKFIENTPNIAGSGPNWLFDIDALTKFMNYKAVVAGNQSNGSAGTKACDNVGKTKVETVPDNDYILLPLWTQDMLFSSSSKDSPGAGFKPLREEEKKDANDPGNEDSEVPSTEEPIVNQKKDANVNNTNNINTVSLTDNAAGIENNDVDENIVYGCADDLNIPDLEEICRFSDAENDDSGAEMNNLDTYFQDERGIMIKNEARLVAQGNTQEEGIDYDEVFAPIARIKAIRLFLAYASFKDIVVYQMNVKRDFLYCKIEEEVYVCQQPSFEDPDFPDRVYKVEKALYGVHQAPRAYFGVDVVEDFKEYMLRDYYCWLRTYWCWNKDLQESKDPQVVVSAAKLPILNPIEFNLWKMRIEHHFLMTDYSLWEVILNDDSPIPKRVIHDKHQLKFNIHKDAKSWMEAIEKRFGGNKETKKVHKTLLKQQYENFNGSSSENLDQIMIGFRSLSANLKFLENPFLKKITNESVSVVTSVFAASTKVLVSPLPNVDTLSDVVIYYFFASQSNSSQLDNDDIKQIDVDDLEEIDLKWQMAMLTMRARSVMVLEAMIRAFRQKKNQQTMPSWNSPPQVLLVLIMRKSQFDDLSYKTGLEYVKARIVIYQQNENVFEEDIKLLKVDVMLRDNALVDLRKKFEKAEQERYKLKLKLENFQTFSKNLSQLLASQTSDKTRLGYDNQVFNSTMFDSDEMFSSESDVSMTTSPVYDRPTKHGVTKAHSPSGRPINLRPSPTHSNFHPKGNPQHALKDKRVIDSGSLRHMLGNISYLFDFEEINRGYVAFGGNPKGGKITSKDKIQTGKLDFDDVYFVKVFNFNLFSVSQMCDKKNIVLFTDTECIVLSSDFKLPDDNHVLLRFPRENNMYNVDLKTIVPSGDLTCLFSKATLDESNLWHRRLSHINFKTMNKLVKGNLVGGLPLKVFENNHTCVACKKGKEHRASCKSKPVSSVSQPLQRLHMDLFGPTFVKSLNKKSYCLVVTDDYTRFCWVFFLATKDETSTVLKTFINGIENQINLKVKIIRSDNETEFKNQDLNQFCRMKGIKRKFSVAGTPQHNGIVERKNRTLIEAPRTMLADSLLPILFWAEAVNTACYVQNRVLVTKPHNKTPYELLLGRTPSIGFMTPFGCHVTILNTLDPLGKFDRKADEGILVGYSVIDIKENDKIKAKIKQNQAQNDKRGKVNLIKVKVKVKVKPVKTGHEFGKSTKKPKPKA